MTTIILPSLFPSTTSTTLQVDPAKWPIEVRDYIRACVNSRGVFATLPVDPPTEQGLIDAVAEHLRREKLRAEATQAAKDAEQGMADMLLQRALELTLEEIVADWDPKSGKPDWYVKNWVEQQFEKSCHRSSVSTIVEHVLNRPDVRAWIQAEHDDWLCRFAVFMDKVNARSDADEFGEPLPDGYAERFAARILCGVVSLEEIASRFSMAIPFPLMAKPALAATYNEIDIGSMGWDDAQWKKLMDAQALEDQLTAFLMETWGLELEERGKLCKRDTKVMLAPVVDLGNDVTIVFEITAR